MKKGMQKSRSQKERVNKREPSGGNAYLGEKVPVQVSGMFAHVPLDSCIPFSRMVQLEHES